MRTAIADMRQYELQAVVVDAARVWGSDQVVRWTIDRVQSVQPALDG